MPAPASFDLTPHPRILPMLGEIVLPQWRCLAELVDNSVDGFLEAKRAGHPIVRPIVLVSAPKSAAGQAGEIVVRDNGPGMDVQTLENAARAGWTSHDPINNLGLFGMGFNIATARLGTKTTIWTTRTGDVAWTGLSIDFDKLVSQKAFATPALSRPKANSEESGTEVVVERIKPEQREWFAKAANISNTRKQLGRIYTSMLGPASAPIAFELQVNGVQVKARLHCVWSGPGNGDRSVQTARAGVVNAFQPIDHRLDSRPFCMQCWNWLGAGQTECPSCQVSETIVLRERHIRGWLGIQRYLDQSEYGIDFIRNGRKIEIGNKDLFKWHDEEADVDEVEYPIDDPRNRGRIVGEVHIDHCRVPYTKDRFLREDAAWGEMVELVRGRGPLRPDKASNLGKGENSSPLYKLFQAFRRSSPHNKKAGGWDKILVVPNNEQATALARKYEGAEPGFETDQKWWDLIEEAEAGILKSLTPSGNTDTLGGGSTSDTPATEPETEATTGESAKPTQHLPRTPIPSLSLTITEERTRRDFEVVAYATSGTDPVLLGAGGPWALRRSASGPWEFVVDPSAPAFRSLTLTPLDALLFELAYVAKEYERGQGDRLTLSELLVGLRSRYARSLMLVPEDLIADAAATLIDIAKSIVGKISADESQAFIDSMTPLRREALQVNMASRGAARFHEAVKDGRFLQYAQPPVIMDFVLSRLDLFFDGEYWDEPFSSTDYGSAVATDEAKLRVRQRWGGLLSDAVWLAEQSGHELQHASRERLIRASLAIDMLAPTVDVTDAGDAP